MSWVLFMQILVLAVIIYLVITATITHYYEQKANYGRAERLGFRKPTE